MFQKPGTTPVSGEDLVDQIRNLEEKLSRVTEERDTTVREHEDLLIMLTDQDAKLKSYKVCERGVEVRPWLFRVPTVLENTVKSLNLEKEWKFFEN